MEGEGPADFPPELEMSANSPTSPTSPSKPKSRTYDGSCHCGKVKYAIQNPASVGEFSADPESGSR